MRFREARRLMALAADDVEAMRVWERVIRTARHTGISARTGFNMFQVKHYNCSSPSCAFGWLWALRPDLAAWFRSDGFGPSPRSIAMADRRCVLGMDATRAWDLYLGKFSRSALEDVTPEETADEIRRIRLEVHGR